MKRSFSNNRFVIFLGVALASCSVWISESNATVQVVGSEGIEDGSLSSSDLQNIFLGKKKSLPSGQRVKIVTLKDGPVHEEFLSNYVNKSASQFSAFWKRKIVDGTGIPPKSFHSETELLDYIKSHEGTIGYISSDTASDGVVIISVE